MLNVENQEKFAFMYLILALLSKKNNIRRDLKKPAISF